MKYATLSMTGGGNEVPDATFMVSHLRNEEKRTHVNLAPSVWDCQFFTQEFLLHSVALQLLWRFMTIETVSPSETTLGAGQQVTPAVPQYPPLTASDLPRLLARDDGRGRIVALRELVKRWACFDEQREAMIAQAPERYRFYDRFTHRRHDLVRVATVVHAMCDRDKVPVPDWVWRHRSRRPIGITKSLDPTSKWGRLVCADAPEACAFHNVWCDQAAIENITVHGFRD